MITRFTEEELVTISIENGGEKTFSSDFVRDRDKHWEGFSREKSAAGQKVWNGKVYCLDKLIQTDTEAVTMCIKTCDYKNYTFILKEGVSQIRDMYGDENIASILTIIGLIKTVDNKYVFGIRNNKTALKAGILGVIGGNINQDEMEIHAFGDFKKYLKYEIEEETLIKVEEQDMKFFSLNYFKTICQLVYVIKSTYHSSEIPRLIKDAEFSELITLTKDELKNYQGDSMLAITYLKHWINEIQ